MRDINKGKSKATRNEKNSLDKNMYFFILTYNCILIHKSFSGAWDQGARAPSRISFAPGHFEGLKDSVFCNIFQLK